MSARHMRERARALIRMIKEQDAIARKHEGSLKRLRGETMAHMQELLCLLDRCYCELGQGSEESEEGLVTQAQEGASEDTEPPDDVSSPGMGEIRGQLRWRTEEARPRKKRRSQGGAQEPRPRSRAGELVDMIQAREAVARERLRRETGPLKEELLGLLNPDHCGVGHGPEEAEENPVPRAQDGAGEDAEPADVEHEEDAEPLGSWDGAEEREEEIREQMRSMIEEARAQEPRPSRRSHGGPWRRQMNTLAPPPGRPRQARR